MVDRASFTCKMRVQCQKRIQDEMVRLHLLLESKIAYAVKMQVVNGNMVLGMVFICNIVSVCKMVL